MKNLIQKAAKTNSLTKDELILLLKNDSLNKEIFDTANMVRKKYVGDEVHLRGLIEFSNICKQNCLYCGIRKDNNQVERYRLEPDEIFETANKIKELGYKTIVMQSGEDGFYKPEKLSFILKEVKKLDMAITLSIGEYSYEDYKAFKKAGADRFLLRIETTDKNLYKKMHPNMSHKNRIECLKNLKKLGFETGTGCLIGLPEQTIESLADDILFFKKMDMDMIGLGPFIPCGNTPLESSNGGSFELALKVMALTRLLMPDINIPATTAMETLKKSGRIIALQSGANVVMPNVTTEQYRKKYNLYPGKTMLHNTPEDYKKFIIKSIEDIGRTISTSQGFRNNNVKNT